MASFAVSQASNPSGFSATGPVFISYRHSDGTETAVRLARVLRAHGVPVWIDENDLPPGDIPNRLREALESGLSGGILVTTPDVATSRDIRETEAPALLQLSTQTSAFSLVVVNDMVLRDGTADRSAPQRVYGGENDDEWRRLRQYKSAELAERERLAADLAGLRLTHARTSRTTEPVVLDVQTRRSGSARDIRGDLVFRTVVAPGGNRLLTVEAWEDLRGFLRRLPDIIAGAGASAVELRGGSHLSVAFAFGAALPVTSGIALTAVDQYGVRWARWRTSKRPSVLRSVLDRAIVRLGRVSAKRPAVFVDLTDSDPPPTFERHLSAHPELKGWWIRSRIRLDNETGPRQVSETATRIRQIASAHGTHEVNLFFRMPWGAAALLGAELNTLVCELYEWDGTVTPARYLPTIVVAAGEGNPVRQIR